MPNADVGILRSPTRRDTNVQTRAVLDSSSNCQEQERRGGSARLAESSLLRQRHRRHVLERGPAEKGSEVPFRCFFPSSFDVYAVLLVSRVVSVVCKEKTKPRPAALNTVELMRVASSGLGMGPHHAMQIAEKLYTQGYISYPRTETTKYPENFDIVYVWENIYLQYEFSCRVNDRVNQMFY